MSLFRIFLVREICTDLLTGQVARYRVFNVMKPQRREVVYRCRNGMMAILSSKKFGRGQVANPRKILKALHASGCISISTHPPTTQEEK